MKIRSSLLLAATAALSLGTLAPAQAADTDPVTNLDAHAVQTPGSSGTFTVTASWTANPDVTKYTVQVHADCTVGSTQYGDTADTTASKITLGGLHLLGDEDYCLLVTAKNVVGATAAMSSFHTAELDTTPPNGRYVLNRTSGYLMPNFDAMSLDELDSARFEITQIQADNDVDVRTVDTGDKNAAGKSVVKPWPSGQTFDLRYSKPGTFTPRVLISDKYGNTRTITLPAVHVLNDRSKPKMKITRPAHPARVKSWRVVRGTVSDKGTGVMGVMVFVMEKRGAIWWTYDAHHHKWLKGTTSRSKSASKSKAWPLGAHLRRNGRWHTPAIKGLRPGTLYVQAAAFDQVFNIGRAHSITKRVH